MSTLDLPLLILTLTIILISQNAKQGFNLLYLYHMIESATVTIYSASWCAFCHMAKKYLDGLKVSYKDIDVDHDPAAAQALVQKTGQAGIPVIEIGEETILGFDRPRIDLALRHYKLI
jgi:glutaredoxin 3